MDFCTLNCGGSKQIPGASLVKTQYHWLGKHEFCSGASFVPRAGGSHEDDGWVVSFVHDEETNTSQASTPCLYIHKYVVQEIRGSKCWYLHVSMFAGAHS
jgi:hypothetical protein